jgi:hypothetical protein
MGSSLEVRTIKMGKEIESEIELKINEKKKENAKKAAKLLSKAAPIIVEESVNYVQTNSYKLRRYI